jgi:hypothetical protein
MIFEREDGGGVDWTYLSQDRERLGILVNRVMKFRVP